MATKKIEITTMHQVNFGSAKDPDYKTYGAIVDCEAAQAARLVDHGYAKYVGQSKAAKKEEKIDGDQ